MTAAKLIEELQKLTDEQKQLPVIYNEHWTTDGGTGMSEECDVETVEVCFESYILLSE